MFWNIGGGIKHYDKLLEMNGRFKEFYDTFHNLFNSVYDSTFGLRWNGGRICVPKDAVPLEEFIVRIKRYNEQNIGFNFSFTNRLLTIEDLDDEYCNFMLQAAIASNPNKLNGVIVASDLLRDYVAERYPELKLIYSVCNGINNLDSYNKATNDKKNDIVVLHPDFNHDFDFLSKLENKEKIEIMVNDVCSFGCPFRAKHYDMLSKYSLMQSKNPIVHSWEELDYGRNNCLAFQAGMVKDGRNKLSFFDLDNMRQMGFLHYKLIGREHDWEYFYNTDLKPNLEKYWIREIIKKDNKNWHI